MYLVYPAQWGLMLCYYLVYSFFLADSISLQRMGAKSPEVYTHHSENILSATNSVTSVSDM